MDDREIMIMDKYFELIYDLCYDYDGYNTVDGLKSLIDEVSRLASLGRAHCDTEPIYTCDDDKLNILMEKIEDGD